LDRYYFPRLRPASISSERRRPLGNALLTLGEREAGTARPKEAVAACREALKEYTRERVPLDWAMTQNSLGNALSSLGSRELKEACCPALK
jgi:hypothetical protein